MRLNDDVIKILSQSMIKAAEKLISAAPFDKTLEGRIIAANNDNTYDVEINKKIRTLKYNGSNTLTVNKVVYVKYPQNDEKRAFIL